MDVYAIATQVMRNCEISNARHWGGYTICGLLLRLMELYRWENGVQPWEKIDHEALLDWTSEQEKRWKEASLREFQNISIAGKNYSPFDLQGINAALRGAGYLYGAGYVGALKASFFLAQIESQREDSGFRIYFLGKELARDLIAMPAMLQGREIFCRREVMRYFLWEKLAEARGAREENALTQAFADYGLTKERINSPPEEIKGDVERIVTSELESYLRHEIGEAVDDIFSDDAWTALVANFPHSRVEFLARGVKDLLADTSEQGMLGYIIKNKKRGSLSFYAANVHGLKKELFPEIFQAYQIFMRTGGWGAVEEARKKGYERAAALARQMTRIYEQGKTNSARMKEEIEKLVAGLGK